MQTSIIMPFPYVSNGIKYNGLMMEIPQDCNECTNPGCLTPTSEISCCYKGYEYITIKKELSIFGFHTNDQNTNNLKKIKALKNHKNIRKIHSSYVYNIVKNIDNEYKSITTELKKILEEDKKKLLLNKNYKKSNQSKELIELKEKFSFIHDYRQINTQLSQNAEVYMHTVLKKDNPSQIDNENFKAIYYGIQLLDEKLNSANILINKEKLFLESTRVPLSLHGICVKLCRIYKEFYEYKGITIEFIGNNKSKIIANKEVLPIIPQTLLDNAIKYSPNNGKITVYFSDEEDFVDFEVRSVGPTIMKGELKEIFTLGVRGENAKKMSDGSGLGLYLANTVAQEHLNTTIKLHQEKINDNLSFISFKVELPFRSK